jgi:hypothetical protein
MTPDFLEGLCQHRFGESGGTAAANPTASLAPSSLTAASSSSASSVVDAPIQTDPRQIESLLYQRDFEQAYSLIAETAAGYWDKGKIEQVAQLLKLAASGLVHDEVAPKSFAKLVSDVAYFYPSKAIRLTEVRPSFLLW